MIVFCQTGLGKILIWQKFSGMWESDYNQISSGNIRYKIHSTNEGKYDK